MNPRLVFPANSLEPKTVLLENAESFLIGRAPSNQITVLDIDVSRCHCEITRNGQVFFLKDLESSNGTFVNGSAIKKIVLQHGDFIRIGQTNLRFLLYDEKAASGQNFQFDDNNLLTHSELLVSVEQSLARMSPDLNALAKFGRAVNEIKNAQSLRNRFLEIILDIVPAGRSALLLFESDSEEPSEVSVVAKNDTESMRISRTICRRVLKDNAALLSNDLTDSDLKTAESVIAARINSVLCVPFAVGEAKALIYLDSSNAESRFTENHLQQLTAISFLISAALEQTISIAALERENERLQNELGIETGLLGTSDKIKKVFQVIKKVSPAESNILITGESGTGKELAAQTIHRNSRRREKPFVAINCAILSETFLESDLFGHERGAFTGAIARKTGKLEHASGGTVFLDEIGELAPSLQAKLLRVLQERAFERVGGSQTITVDIRLIAATNRNLSEEVKNGKFREDLFFRLNVVKLNMPPLRERRADILPLAEHFIKKFSERCRRKVTGLSKSAQSVLTAYSWSGNVRELENAIERAVVMGTTETILIDDLPEEIVESGLPNQTAATDFHRQLKTAKQKIIVSAIEEAGGNYSEAARRLGIHANNLHRLIRSLDIKEEIKKV